MNIVLLKSRMASKLNDILAIIQEMPDVISEKDFIPAAVMATDAKHLFELTEAIKEAVYASNQLGTNIPVTKVKKSTPIGFEIPNDDDDEVPTHSISEPKPEKEQKEESRKETTDNKPATPPKPEPKKEPEVVPPAQERVVEPIPTYKPMPKPAGVSIKQLISFNDKFLYMNELFGKNFEEYNACIEEIDRLPDFNTTITYLQENFVAKYDWENKPETADRFTDMCNRKFKG